MDIRKITNLFEDMKATGKQPGEFTDEELSNYDSLINDDFEAYITDNLPKTFITEELRETLSIDIGDDWIEWLLTVEGNLEYDRLQELLIDEFKKITGEFPDETSFDGGIQQF